VTPKGFLSEKKTPHLSGATKLGAIPKPGVSSILGGSASNMQYRQGCVELPGITLMYDLPQIARL